MPNSKARWSSGTDLHRCFWYSSFANRFDFLQPCHFVVRTHTSTRIVHDYIHIFPTNMKVLILVRVMFVHIFPHGPNLLPHVGIRFATRLLQGNGVECGYCRMRKGDKPIAPPALPTCEKLLRCDRERSNGYRRDRECACVCNIGVAFVVTTVVPLVHVQTLANPRSFNGRFRSRTCPILQ